MYIQWVCLLQQKNTCTHTHKYTLKFAYKYKYKQEKKRRWTTAYRYGTHLANISFLWRGECVYVERWCVCVLYVCAVLTVLKNADQQERCCWRHFSVWCELTFPYTERDELEVKTVLSLLPSLLSTICLHTLDTHTYCCCQIQALYCWNVCFGEELSNIQSDIPIDARAFWNYTTGL